MRELAQWQQEVAFPPQPWLLLGKGPTFAQRGAFDLSGYHRIGLNHVVRELPLDIAHVIDVDVVAACAEALPRHARWLVMPRHPHVDCRPDPARPLESFFTELPVLRWFSERGRLVWYDLQNKTCPQHGRGAPLRVRFFSSEAALQLVARLGGTVVRSLGVDGGARYSAAFGDLQQSTLLRNGQPSFDLQFRELRRITEEHGLDYRALVPPLRIFLGGDATTELAANVLAHSLTQHASRALDVTLLSSLPPAPGGIPLAAELQRYRIPEQCSFAGRALYLDGDLLALGDVAPLWDLSFGDSLVLRPPSRPPYPVLLLDCARLPWRSEALLGDASARQRAAAALGAGACGLAPGAVAERLPSAWLQQPPPAVPASGLLQCAAAASAPWLDDASPCNAVWMAAFVAAVAGGAVDPQLVRRSVAAGHVKPGLLAALERAPAFWAWRPAAAQPAAAAEAAATAVVGAAPTETRSWRHRLRRLLRRTAGGAGPAAP